MPGLRLGSIARHGTGTERLEAELDLGVPVFRLDADVGDPAPVLARFQAAPRGILVGTQMVAKGHDFPDVDLGVVVDADATLRFPDFRAEERTFALVTQLAGRAGRGAVGGRVLVQTLAPEARSIVLAARHDADTFVAERAGGAGRCATRRSRRSCGSCARPTGRGAAQAAAAAVKERLVGGAAGAALGPAPLFRLRGRERAQVVVEAAERRAAVAAIDAAVQGGRRGPGRSAA